MPSETKPQQFIAKEALDYKGLSRKGWIPSSVVSLPDSALLYSRLDQKAIEVVEKLLAESTKPDDQTEEDFEQLKEQAREVGHLTVLIHGEDGDEIVKSSKDIFEMDLPETINTITFDSSAGLQTFNVNMLNRFTLTLDFAEPPGFNTYNPWDEPTPNKSVFEVKGADHTWVTAVRDTILTFFQGHKRRRRAWLHSWLTFNILNWLVGIPASFWVVYRLDTSFQSFFANLHGALQGAIYVYVMLLAMLIFRLIIAGFRWIFPKVELEGARSKKARKILGYAQSTLLLALVYDVLKHLFLNP